MADLAETGGPVASPRVSIGLPVYNGVRFLERSIRSVLDQDYTDLELIISDNGSTDDTLALVDRIVDGDSRVVVLTSDENRGAAWNYNNAFHRARGEFFRWHADDDWFEPSLIGKLVDALDREPDAVLAHSWTRFVDDDGQTTREFKDDLGAEDTKASRRLTTVVRRLTFCNPVFGLIRRSALAETALIESFPGSDATLLYELSLHGRFVVVPEFLYNRRPGNSIKSNPSMRAVAEWFGPSARGGRFPAALQAKACLAAIGRAPLAAGERGRCGVAFARVWPIDYARKSRRRARRRQAVAQ